MRQVITRQVFTRQVFAIAACGFSLVGCTSSWMPSTDFLKSAPMTETLRFESEPSNAEARVSPTQACRTPCELQVVPTGDMAVTFSLQGYETQAQSVRLLPPGDPDTGSSDFRLYPNPVFAELDPAAAPTRRPPAKKAAPTKRTAAPPAAAPAPRAAPAPAAAPAQRAAPPSNSPFPPAPAAQFPPPPAPSR